MIIFALVTKYMKLLIKSFPNENLLHLTPKVFIVSLHVCSRPITFVSVKNNFPSWYAVICLKLQE